MINFFIFFVLLSVPISLLLFNINYPDIKGNIFFIIFCTFVMLERIWETFFTSKERDVRRGSEDWTLILTSIMYFVTCLFVIIEFYTLRRGINFYISCIGIFIFFSAALLRYFSVRTLGDQWAIHAVGKSKLLLNKHILRRKGPYKYIRHPIYLGIILELFGIVIVANSYYSILLVLIINAPLYIQRAIEEEKTSMVRFGDDYIKYRNEVPFILPLFFIKKK